MDEGKRPRHIKDRTFDFAVAIIGFCQSLDLCPAKFFRQLVGADVEHGRATMRTATRRVAPAQLADDGLHFFVTERLPGFDGGGFAHP